MNKNKKSSLFFFLIFLVAAGSLAAFAGIYGIDGASEKTGYFQSLQNDDIDFHLAVESFEKLHAGLNINIQPEQRAEPVRPASQKGITVGEMMRWAGVLAVFVAITILLFIEFFYRSRINRLNYRVLLIVSLFVLPVIVGLGTSVTMLETTKSVESCATCHVMDPFVNDLFDPNSTTLASRHYKNGWISESQCYTCHTTYGAHGTFEGKRDGFRHWLLYVTKTWDDPIAYAGSYPNINCTSCHGGTTAFREIPSHQALRTKLDADEVSCTSCHGPSHPTPNERADVPERGIQAGQPGEVNNAELDKLMGYLNE